MVNYSRLAYYAQDQYTRLVSVKEADAIDDRYGRRRRQAQKMGEALADAQSATARAHGEAMQGCSTLLWLHRGEDGERKLAGAQLCRSRLCPVCTWRRSLKAYGINNEIAVEADYQRQGRAQWVMATLTMRNVGEGELADGLSELMDASARLLRRKAVRAGWAGTLRNVEVTYNPEAHTWHPHIHILALTTASYWGRDYISNASLSDMWAESLRCDYGPITDVRKVRGTGAVAEVSKYPVKLAGYDRLPAYRLTDVLGELDDALYGRRMMIYGGELARIKRELRLADAEELDDDDARDTDAGVNELAVWDGMYYRLYDLFASTGETAQSAGRD